MNKSIGLLALVMMLVSCDNTSFPGYPDTPPDELVLLKRIVEIDVFDEVTTYDFTYDGNKLVLYSDSNGVRHQYLYENDQLIRINNYFDGQLSNTLELEYDSENNLASYVNYYLDEFFEDLAHKFVYTINPDETITETMYGGNHDSQTIFMDEFVYTFDNGNIISEVSTEDGYALYYDFDTRNGALSNISAIDILNLISIDFGGFEQNRNNLISMTESYEGMSYTQTLEYVYNEHDYPVMASSYDEEELHATLEYLYE